MIFTELPLSGAFVVDLEPHRDPRGFFARSFCSAEFEAHGLNPRIVQCNISYSPRRGTLRGLHYQLGPALEAKLVRCTRGSIHDVMVDMRAGSPTLRKHHAMVLSGNNHRMLYVPDGVAHGFLTLEDDTEVFYQMSELYSDEQSRGLRWDDPALGIAWPEPVQLISDRDRSYPDLDPFDFSDRAASTRAGSTAR